MAWRPCVIVTPGSQYISTPGRRKPFEWPIRSYRGTPSALKASDAVMWLVIGTDAPVRNTNWSDTVLTLLGVVADTMLPREAVPVSRGLASHVPPPNVVTRPICL